MPCAPLGWKMADELNALQAHGQDIADETAALVELLALSVRELSGFVGVGDTEDLLESLANIQEQVVLLDSLIRVPEALYTLLLSARKLIQKQTRRQPLQFNGRQGRPAILITKEQIELLLDANFSVPAIANLLGVSSRTVQRRMQEFALSIKANYANVEDNVLDGIVLEIKRQNPVCGSKMLSGYLRAKDLFLPRSRIRESLRRVDPLGVAARRCGAIKRRVYDVTRPLALWHLDGNHKLVKWRMVVHGCVDGYSRIPVFLKCSTNNRAATVLANFSRAVGKYGLPSRSRCDQGSENVDVVQYMLNMRGEGRGSALVGKSVHNQRVERLWRDVNVNVLYNFSNLFSLMEEIGILDPLSDIDIWCLHYAFLDYINHCLDEWSSSWMRHRISSMHNKTPLQLWIEGSMLAAESNIMPTVPDNYGVDWQGPVPIEEELQTVVVPDTVVTLSEEQNNELTLQTAYFRGDMSYQGKVELFRLTKIFVGSNV